MKRIFALLLAGLLLVGIRPAAYAQEGVTIGDEPPGWLNIKPKEEAQPDDGRSDESEISRKEEDEYIWSDYVAPGWGSNPRRSRRRKSWLRLWRRKSRRRRRAVLIS